MKQRLRSPIIWFGGKGHMVLKLLPYVPKHTYYIEAFGGGASLLFAKPPSKFEVYNDIDGGLVNFFKVLADEEKFERLYKKICVTPCARAIYNEFTQTWDEMEDEVERAYRWFVVARMSFSGRFGAGWNFGITTLSPVKRWLSMITLLPQIHARIMRVQIECKHWKDLLDTYSGYKFTDEFIYLDPPYMPETRKGGGYRYEMTREDHEELIDYLLTHKRRAMLSGYDNELYQTLEKYDWKKVCWDVACHAVGRTRASGLQGEGVTHEKNQRRQECIWMNYDLKYSVNGLVERLA